jgi:hypothetical protein
MEYQEMQSVTGSQFGADGVDELVERAEAVCRWEQQRIDLTNEAPLVAKKAEYTVSLEEERELRALLARTPRPLNNKSRSRRIATKWIIAAVLIVSGFILSLLTLEPFRFGIKGALYCLGVALVVPFLVERMLSYFASELFKKIVITLACFAGLTSLVLLADIRGHLFAEQLRQDDSPAVIEGDELQKSAAPSTFYQDAVPLLRLVMALLALTMEIGAGVAVLEAEQLSDAVDGEYEGLVAKLSAVRARLATLAQEIVKLQNEAPIFGARFWRDFYWALLRGTVKNAAKRFVLSGLVLLIMICPRAWSAPTQELELVVVVDLSKSVAQKSPDGQTEFTKNLAAVTVLLGRLPPGTHVTVLGITENSFQQPYVILKASLNTDAGYFGALRPIGSGRKTKRHSWSARISWGSICGAPRCSPENTRGVFRHAASDRRTQSRK